MILIVRMVHPVGFDEPVFHVAGTAVAFLRKQDGSSVVSDSGRESVAAFAKNAGARLPPLPRSGERAYERVATDLRNGHLVSAAQGLVCQGMPLVARGT